MIFIANFQEVFTLEENRNTYTIYDNNEIGKVKISDDVIAIIAGVAATDVEGVASIGAGITRELVIKSGVKKLQKAVVADVIDGMVDIRISVNLKYGYSVIETSKDVQEKIKYQIEGMTGLSVSSVNVQIASVDVQ